MAVELNLTIRGGDADKVLHHRSETIYLFYDWDSDGNTLVVQDNYYEPVAITLMDVNECKEHVDVWIAEGYTTFLTKGE